MLQVPGRTAFSEKDIEHLLKYLGRYSNPGSGRMGNTLYKKLVENADGRWPWSQRHTWQSWRDHYKRNAADYDKKIPKLQRKKGLIEGPTKEITSRPAQPTGSKRKASGTAEELPSAKRLKPSSNAVAGPSNSQPKPHKQGSLFTDSEDDEVSQAHQDMQPPSQRRPGEVEGSTWKSVRAPLTHGCEGQNEERAVAKAEKAGTKDKAPPTNAGAVSKTTQTSGTSEPTSNTAKPLSKPKPRLIPRKRIVDEDSFVSSPSARSPPVSQPPSSSPRRKPPKYIEGPFRNTLGTGSSWPPARRASKTKTSVPSIAAAITPSPEMMPPPKPLVRTNATATSSNSRPLPSPSPSRSKQVQQHVAVNATPSSSKALLPPGRYQYEVIDLTQDPPSLESRAKPAKKYTPASAQSAHGSATRNPAPIKVSMNSLGKLTSGGQHSLKENGKAKRPSGVSKDMNSRPTRPITAARSFPQTHEPKNREPSLHRRGSDGDAGAHSDDREDEAEDVFIEKKPSPRPPAETHSNDLRRNLQIHRMPAAPIPHIDLKDVSGSAVSRSRRQSSTSTASRTSSRRGSLALRRDSLLSHGSRRSSSVAIRDTEIFEQAGRQKLLGDMAKRYGFDFSVAAGAYGRLQDLEKTQAFLSRLRDEADAAGRALLSEFLDDESEDGNEEGEGGDGERAQSVPVDELRDDTDTASISTLQQLKKSHTRRSSGARQSLTIRPIPDEEVDKYALTVEEYSAPRRSRAGKYARQHRPHIMPYSQTPGAMLGQSPYSSEERSPPQIDLNQYSSSPLRAKKSMDQESLPPSSPPREHDDEEGPDEEERDDLEDKYEDLFGGVERGTSPDEVEQELFERFDADDDQDDDGGDRDANAGTDTDDDDDDREGSEEEDKDADRAETGEVPESDSDANPAGEEAPEGEGQHHPQYIFSRLHQADQKLQRQLARFANSVNRDNKHKMEKWEAKQDPGILAAHHMLLCQIVLQKLKEGAEKPFRLDDYYDEALQDSEEE